jgi:ABC-type branched-subunit amino acid transport system substrate-binding protein
MSRNTSGNSGGPVFRLPPRPARDSRLRKGLIGLAVLVVVAAAAVVIVRVSQHPAPPARRRASSALQSCRGSGPAPLEVFKYQGLCLGLTDGSYVFNPGLARIEGEIAQADAAVVKQNDYVTVALLTPMTASPASDVSLARIQDELAGAYAAQYETNSSGYKPEVRLVLANEGTSLEQGWKPVAGLLASTSMTGAPVNLRAVIGMGISVTQTVDGARILSDAGIPMIGSVTTADELDWSNIPGLSRVVPDVSVQLAALRGYFAAHGGLRSAFLVYDSDSSDMYTSNLTSDFTADFGSYIQGRTEPFGPGPGSANEFKFILLNICPSGSGTPPAVLYSGRESLLPTLISQVQKSPNCDGKQLTIVTGSDAVALPPSQTTDYPGQGRVTVIYSDIENPSTPPTHQAQLAFTGSDAGTASLADPWTIATYNAMAAASAAITGAAGGSRAIPPLSSVLGLVRDLTGRAQVAGATGAFSIGPTGDLANPAVPIVEITNNSTHVLSP